MSNQTRITALPVGEFDTAALRAEFETILGVFRHLEAALTVAEPVTDEAGAQRFVQHMPDPRPDLLLLIPLRGLSAQTLEAAGRAFARPCLLWPVSGRFALPSSTLAAGALREAGVPVELLFAPPDHPLALARAGGFIRAATSYSRLRRSRIGVVGGLFPNLVSCRYDPHTVHARLGPTVVPLAYDALRTRLQNTAFAADETQAMAATLTREYAVAPADTAALQAGLKLHHALKLAAQEQQLDAFATECWTGLPRELGLNPCLGFAEDAYTLACEGDVILSVSLLLVRYLTGVRAYVGDLYDVDLAGRLTLVHCGGPASLAASPASVVLGPSQTAHQRGYETFTCRPRLPAGPATLFRLYGQNCDQLHVAQAQLLDCEQSPNLSVSLQLGGNRWDFLSQALGNHYIVAPGDIRPELSLLAEWLGLHTVET